MHRQRCERLQHLERDGLLTFVRSYQDSEGRWVYVVTVGAVMRSLSRRDLDLYLDGVEAAATRDLTTR